MPEINGKSVVFADRLPARQWWALWQKITEIKSGDKLLERLDWDTCVQLCQSVIVSWEFDGDPGDAASYEALHFPAMVELVTEAYAHAIGLLNAHGADGLGE